MKEYSIEEYKYEYSGVPSKTKLPEPEARMVGWYSELFSKLGDKLLKVSASQRRLYTENRIIELIPFPYTRMLGSSVRIVEAVLKRLEDKYQVLFAKEDESEDNLKDRVEYKILRMSSFLANTDYESSLNEVLEKIDQLPWHRVDTIDIVYNHQHKTVTYGIYEPTKDIQRILFQDRAQMAEVMKHSYADKLTYQINKDRLLANKYISVSELQSFFFALKKEEETLGAKLFQKAVEAIDEYIKNNPKADLSKLEIEIKEIK